MKVLITGAAGLLGTDLCRVLGERHEVAAWSRRAASGIDITDDRTVAEAIRQARPAVVVHTAAMTDVDGCERDPKGAWKTNVDGARAVAAGCASVGACLVAVSTDYVFDGLAGRPYRESDAPNPVSHYGRSKLEGEQEALRACPRTLVVRVSGLFGSARANFVSMAFEKLKAGQRVPVVTDQVNSPSYTGDLAWGIGRLLERLEREPGSAAPGGELHGPLHLANAGGATREQVGQLIADHMGASRNLLERTTWAALQRPARRPPRSDLDCGRFARLAGKGMRPWEDAVRAFLEKERETKVCHG